MNNKELNTIIFPGMVIKTKHPKSTWISNVVHRVYENIIEVELTQEYINNLILIGDPLKCKFSTEEAEYIMDGIIEDIIPDSAKVIAIRINNINRFQNMRSNHRYETCMISKMTVHKNITVFGIVTNISSSGISVLTKLDLSIPSEVFVEIFLNNGNTLRFYGEIIRKTPEETGFELGIRFATMDSENNNILNELLNQLKSKEDELTKKFYSYSNS